MAGWFEDVFGFPEDEDYEKVRTCFRVETNDNEEHTLITIPPKNYEASGERRFHVGRFETPSVEELDSLLPPTCTDDGLTFRHVTGNVLDYHMDPAFSEGAVFQAASQFNCLEMSAPDVTPDDGITGYFYDRTQGPICAMACPAGTLYRNYFVDSHGQGGTRGKQLDLLADVGSLLGNNWSSSSAYWEMENGYAMPTRVGAMEQLRGRLEQMQADEYQALTKALRVGVHWDTELVRASDSGEPGRVAQVYSSALPVAYDPTRSSDRDWEPFARLVLQGTYDATLAVGAILAARRNQRVRVYLTKVGGGVFGNPTAWISSAIQKSLDRYQQYPLDVILIHYGELEGDYTRVLKQRGC